MFLPVITQMLDMKVNWYVLYRAVEDKGGFDEVRTMCSRLVDASPQCFCLGCHGTDGALSGILGTRRRENVRASVDASQALQPVEGKPGTP